ncbi:MAG: hypothetical protein QHH43_06085 [Candidatus Saccharicenans sp.]|nr:hypothetical protein [Candidatus Saccharicenans sp.]MDH7575310.1 hypothetical protein [Candidatus Saccharicenans sp.]
MDEKDLSRMSDEELKEFIKKFYAELDKKSDCVGCPVTSCPRRRPIGDQETEESAQEDTEEKIE